MGNPGIRMIVNVDVLQKYFIQISDDVQILGPRRNRHGFGCGEAFWGSSSESAPDMCLACQNEYRQTNFDHLYS